MRKVKTTQVRGIQVCKHEINAKYCNKCKYEAAGVSDHPLVRSLVEQGRVSVRVQVYVNWEKGGVGGMEHYLGEFESLGLVAPTPYEDECPLVLDGDGNVKSPWYSWQGKVAISGPVDDATKEAVLMVAGKDADSLRASGDGIYLHSNSLVRSVLAMGLGQAPTVVTQSPSEPSVVPVQTPTSAAS